jgi:hypothetical protein
MMAGLIMVAALVTGGLAGSFLTMTVAAAAMSRSQERMQRKIRYWQAETLRARWELRQAVPRELRPRRGGR